MDNQPAILQNPVFSSLNDKERERVYLSAVRRPVQKGEYLVLQGDFWPYLFIIEQGAVVAEKDAVDGRTFVAATFQPGEVFWGLGFFLENAVMPASLKVIKDGVIYQWEKRDLVPLIEGNGIFSWELCKLVVSRIQYVSEVLETMTFQPIAVRLARLLMGISESGRQRSITRNLTLDDMAARIGSTREMVCRLLYKFSDEGLIRITRTEFTITDAENLERRAQR